MDRCKKWILGESVAAHFLKCEKFHWKLLPLTSLSMELWIYSIMVFVSSHGLQVVAIIATFLFFIVCLTALLKEQIPVNHNSIPRNAMCHFLPDIPCIPVEFWKGQQERVYDLRICLKEKLLEYGTCQDQKQKRVHTCLWITVASPRHSRFYVEEHMEHTEMGLWRCKASSKTTWTALGSHYWWQIKSQGLVTAVLASAVQMNDTLRNG